MKIYRKKEGKSISSKKLAVVGFHVPAWVVGVVVVLLASTVFTSVTYSAKGSELLSLEQEIAEINSENRELKEQMVSEMSLTLVGENASKMGMITPTNLFYLNTSDSLATLR